MPTIKQKRTLEKMIENGGNVGKAMLAAGYTEATAKNPKNLTESKGWIELLNEYLPDEKLATVHKELLESEDLNAKKAGLDMAYKIKGYYSPEKLIAASNSQMNVRVINYADQKSEDEAMHLLAEKYENELLALYNLPPKNTE